MSLRKLILLSVLFSMLVGCGGPWSSGDRVLVSKFPYDSGVSEPHRFDVVVFKYPLGPVENNTPKNYIKRLLGLPGELLAIFFGRLYRCSYPANEPPFDDWNNPNLDRKTLYNWEYLHANKEPARNWFEEGIDKATGKERQFEILRKPPEVMLAMRRNVYDNDYQAADLKGKLDRWNPQPKSNWKADKETTFVCQGKAADQVDWLRYQHLLRPDAVLAGDEKVAPQLITDVLGYNSFQTRSGIRAPSEQHWVGDLMLECNLEVIEPKGEFWFELSKGIHRFRARWDLSSGQCTLYRVGMDHKSEEFGVAATPVKGPGSYLVRFANFDARLTVWVDRELPFGAGKEYDPPEIRAPHEKKLPLEEIVKRRGPTENDLEPASIGSKDTHVKISHVRLWRDTYYLTSTGGGNKSDLVDYENSHSLNEAKFWSDPSRWDTIRKARFVTYFVQPEHYLCLGDNSPQSSDSREWGMVPHRLMLGRALLVYFPLDRMEPIR